MSKVNKTKKSAVTPLDHDVLSDLADKMLLAIEESNKAKVEDLIRQGADVNWVHHFCDGDTTALLSAIQSENESICNLLLKHRARIDTQLMDGPTALHLAAGNGMLSLCKKLVKLGAGVDVTCTRSKRTTLDFACKRGHLKIVKMLIKSGANPNFFRNSGFSPLFTAAENGHDHICKELINAGAEVDCRTSLGTTALMYSSRSDRSIECTKLLLERGADINAMSALGHDALHHAMESDEALQTIDLLYTNERFKNKAYGLQEKTAFHKAAEKDKLEACMYFLLKRNESIHAKDKLGNTPLHSCMENAQHQSASFLMGKGADVSLKNNEELTPLHLLCGAKSSVWNEKRRVEILDELISKGADVHEKTKKGWTPLHLAAKLGSEKLCIALMNHGADATAKNEAGLTPIGVAGRHQKKAVGDAIRSYAQSLSARRAVDGLMDDLKIKACL
jgi:ankyrin repeat protein